MSWGWFEFYFSIVFLVWDLGLDASHNESDDSDKDYIK